MKTLRLFLLISALLWLAVSAQAQTLMTTTTLAANVTGDRGSAPADSVIQVTSATGFTVGNFVWADSEQMLITAINGTSITVRRGQNGTRTQAHDNADRIYTGAAAHFHTNDPDYGADCTRGQGDAAYMPWINVQTGNFWTCRAESSTWNGTNAATVTYDSRPTSF